MIGTVSNFGEFDKTDSLKSPFLNRWAARCAKLALTRNFLCLCRFWEFSDQTIIALSYWNSIRFFVTQHLLIGYVSKEMYKTVLRPHERPQIPYASPWPLVKFLRLARNMASTSISIFLVCFLSWTLYCEGFFLHQREIEVSLKYFLQHLYLSSSFSFINYIGIKLRVESSR